MRGLLNRNDAQKYNFPLNEHSISMSAPEERTTTSGNYRIKRAKPGKIIFFYICIR